MNVKEIRALGSVSCKNNKEEGEVGWKLVAELVAQLAEINESLKGLLEHKRVFGQ